jgi:prophage regulatory protein
MELPNSQLTTPKVFTKAALKLIGLRQSNGTLLRWERRGEFPRRYYLSSRCPVWNVAEICEWLAERQAAAGEPSRLTAQATASRTRRRQAKPALAGTGHE